jgi:hypothetical protein
LAGNDLAPHGTNKTVGKAEFISPADGLVLSNIEFERKKDDYHEEEKALARS